MPLTFSSRPIPNLIMPSTVEFERASAYLQQSDDQGQSLYAHLSNLLLHLTSPVTTPNLSSLSLSLKRAHLPQLHLPELPSTTSLPPSSLRLLQHVKAELSLLAPFTGRARKTASAAIPNLLDSAELLQAAGVALGREELLTLTAAIAQVATAEGLSNLRFWGVVYGTTANYYVLESAVTPSASAAQGADPTAEAAGTGVNAFTYYVASTPLGPFTALPPAVPSLIATSVSLHRLFTGDLTAPVAGHPAFPGTEADLLRCAIARISHGAFAAPKGSHAIEESEEGVESIAQAPDWEGASPEDLRDLASWVHLRAKLLRKGRTTPYVKPEVEDGADEAKAEEAEEPEDEEEALPALSSLDADEPPSTTLSSFVVRSTPSAGHPHALTSVTSTLWPGAYSLCKRRATLNVYVGWGLKYRGAGVGGWRRAAMDAMGTEWTEAVEDGEEPLGLMKEQDDEQERVEDKDDQDEAAAEDADEDAEDDADADDNP